MATMRAPYDGTTPEGLGLGVDMACFERVYGAAGVDGRWAITMEADEIWLSVATDRAGLVTELAIDYTYSE